jgi:hypothetical protein
VFKPGRSFGDAITEALRNAAVHLSPGFLFQHGDLDKLQHPPGAGQLYWIQLPLILVACVAGLWHTGTRQAVLALLVWIGAAIVPTSLTQMNVAASGHSLRSIPMVVGWQILSAAGLRIVAGQFNAPWRRILIVVVTATLLVQAVPYLYHYFVEYPNTVRARFDDGMREAVEAMDALDGHYDTVIFTRQASWPYLHILFFTQYDPHKLQDDLPVRESKLFAPVTRVGKYRIGDVKAAYQELDHGLFVMPAWMLPDVDPLVITTYHNGSPAFKIVTK